MRPPIGIPACGGRNCPKKHTKIKFYFKNLLYKRKPVDPIDHTATGVMHESQSRGVNKLLLQTAPLLFTQTSHEAGSEPGYDFVEHSNKVM